MQYVCTLIHTVYGAALSRYRRAAAIRYCLASCVRLSVDLSLISVIFFACACALCHVYSSGALSLYSHSFICCADDVILPSGNFLRILRSGRFSFHLEYTITQRARTFYLSIRNVPKFRPKLYRRLRFHLSARNIPSSVIQKIPLVHRQYIHRLLIRTIPSFCPFANRRSLTNSKRVIWFLHIDCAP